MDEAEYARLAEATREKMLRIWDGDAASADAFLCVIMRYYKDHSGDVSPEARECVLQRMMQLLQR